eukprot:TRINITY_DN38466_c0_g1_i1.p1 TRINITY_DN38466_c0_g1~~TRINITY_DN38466_c0_g1_i1.p1  ORF type:complete len:941 (-),score=100.92 TRINITY_DN38466_c0_g1_i1:466-3234(-)
MVAVSRFQLRRGPFTLFPRTSWAIAVVGVLPAALRGDSDQSPSWLPAVHLEDYDCRQRVASDSLVDWSEFRRQLKDVSDRMLDPATLNRKEGISVSAWRRKAQAPLLEGIVRIGLHFERAVRECPMGALVASIVMSCLAHVPVKEASDSGELQPSVSAVFGDVVRTPFNVLVARDLSAMLEMAPLHVIAATEWCVFALLHIYTPMLRPSAMSLDSQTKACADARVAGHESEQIRYVVRKNMAFASGKDISGLKFLRALDPLVSSVMRDPTEFKTQYLVECPAGAATFAVTSALLALMSNPSLFERFAHTAHFAMYQHIDVVVAGAEHWGLFHGLTKLSSFATRGFDLVWSRQELLPLPGDADAFDRLRLDAAARGVRLAFASRAHPHASTRALARFMSSLPPPTPPRREHLVYLTAVGGHPFVDYIAGFVDRAVTVGLPALVIACMDTQAETRCRAASARGQSMTTVHCLVAVEGHVVLVKHAFIPLLLSMGIDTVWIDFDTFILRDPTDAILEARDFPSRLLPKRERVRFGSFLFDDSADLCNLTKICDSRLHWPFDIGSDGDGTSDGTAEMLVTEHWDARCLNNGLFYVRATHRPLIFFVLFLAQLHANPYADNQNLIDSFLSHSTFDTAAPEHRPFLRYGLLDISRRFGCADGHAAEDLDELLTFHFWSSDFKTREAEPDSVTGAMTVAVGECVKDIEACNGGQQSPDLSPSGLRSRIRTRSGVERVSKVQATKSELFEVFFGSGTVADQNIEGVASMPVAGAAFIRSVKAPPPAWKGMCSVTAVGVEELLDERLLQNNQATLDWDSPHALERIDDLFGAHATIGDGGNEVELSSPPLPSVSTKQTRDCSGIPLRDWASAIRIVGTLEQKSLLNPREASTAKHRLHRLDTGSLLTIQAYMERGSKRLAIELRQSLADVD